MSTETGDRQPLVVKGSVLAPGVAHGRVHFEEPMTLPRRLTPLDARQIEEELALLERSIGLVRQMIEQHINQREQELNQDIFQILKAHLMILEDVEFFKKMEDLIKSVRCTADEAIRKAFERAVERLAGSNDLYTTARIHDLRDVCQNLRMTLLHGPTVSRNHLEPQEEAVFASSNLYPEVVLRARRARAVAFVTASRAAISHGAILLRASGIPAVGGVEFPPQPIPQGTPILVDGLAGQVTLWPTPEMVAEAKQRAVELAAPLSTRLSPPLEIKLSNGRQITLWANIEHPDQAGLCSLHRLHGVGLFRTEFLLFNQAGRVPNEDEQVAIYLRVIEQLAGRPLVIRTLDTPAPQNNSCSLDQYRGNNPALGLRGIRRHLLHEPEELKTQLKAIMRAAVGADVSILLPMVTHQFEVRRVREMLAQVCSELEQSRVLHNPQVPLGAMIEVPAAALGVGDILKEVDFVNIGTNDLIQYLTAADRGNPDLLEYHTVEVSRLESLIKTIVDCARTLHREEDVSVCGDMASEPSGALRLVSAGISSLSVIPSRAEVVAQALGAYGAREIENSAQHL